MNRRVRTVLGLCGAAVVCAASGSAAAAVTLPSADPFYAVPPGISGLANGAILASRSVAVSAYSLPVPVHAWQVKYKTTDDQGDASADVATVMVPDVPWTGKGPPPACLLPDRGGRHQHRVCAIVRAARGRYRCREHIPAPRPA